jgi:hypothetical protein
MQRNFSGGVHLKKWEPVVAGDLYIHLLSGTHFITNSKGPESIYSSVSLAIGKTVAICRDVMAGVMQYGDTAEHPAFQYNTAGKLY